MADSDLVCNFRKCRKRLTNFAWVTSCSRETNLLGKFDIIRVDLQPSEEYKSMVLAGLKPEVIMEVCSRAIAFWTYQAHNERVYHEYVSTRAKESKNQLEKYYESLLAQIQNELNTVKSEITMKSKELADTKQRLSEVTEKQADKSRQLQRLQAMYDSLRRKMVTPVVMSDASADTEMLHAMKNSFTLPIGASSGIQRGLPNEVEAPQRPEPTPSREFTFTPVPMVEPSNDKPVFPGTKANSLYSRFQLDIGTPRSAAK